MEAERQIGAVANLLSEIERGREIEIYSKIRR